MNDYELAVKFEVHVNKKGAAKLIMHTAEKTAVSDHGDGVEALALLCELSAQLIGKVTKRMGKETGGSQ